MVGTGPFTRVSVEAKPALRWPSLLKQSDVKWLAHTHKLSRTVASMLLLQIKRNHYLFFCSVAGTEYRHWCWLLQPTTECLALGNDIVKRCYLTAGHTPNFTSGMNAPLLDISRERGECFCGEEAGLWKSLLLLSNDRSWIWTACRSAVLPVGGLQRPCRTCLLSSFWGKQNYARLRENQFI